MENEELTEENGFKITSVRITGEDWAYCKEHKLQFTKLIQDRIAQIKAVESGAIVNNVTRERELREKYQELSEKMSQFMEENKILSKFWENNPA